MQTSCCHPPQPQTYLLHLLLGKPFWDQDRQILPDLNARVLCSRGEFSLTLAAFKELLGAQ